MTYITVHNTAELTPAQAKHVQQLAAALGLPLVATLDPDGTHLAVDDDDDQEGD